MLSRTHMYIGVMGALLLSAACDKAQLLAPTNATITISAPTRLLPSNGSTEVSAFVLEQAGTPVQNGTTVRFLTSLGRVDPAEVQTRNGIAITTFFAGNTSGVAEVRATSGAATGGTGDSATNVLMLTIGAAAVNTVTLRANPGTVSANGSTVELIATVVAENGRPLEGILVTFNADQGSLASSTAVTNANGEARTTLTASELTVVSATAGATTSSNVIVTARPGPAVTLTCAPASGTGSCAAMQASASNSMATVVFTVTRATGSSTFRTATLDFGDGSSQTLGNLAGGSTVVTHAYAGPEGDTSRVYTATVHVTDINNETTAASNTVIVTPRTPINVGVTATGDTATTAGQRWTFTAVATGGGEGTGNAPIQTFTWNFGDGSGEVVTSGSSTAHVYTSENNYTVTVTAKTADGRSAVGRTEILVNLP